jgi:hypothetical protein
MSYVVLVVAIVKFLKIVGCCVDGAKPDEKMSLIVSEKLRFRLRKLCRVFLKSDSDTSRSRVVYILRPLGKLIVITYGGLPLRSGRKSC